VGLSFGKLAVVDPGFLKEEGADLI